MARRRRKSRKSSGAACGCPTGARRISTKGRGSGFVCQSLDTKRFVRKLCR